MRCWYKLLIGIAITIACSNDTLHIVCPSECYTADESIAGVGECKKGTPICDDEANILSCVGSVVPTLELCDKKDNDCDGTIDEDITHFNVSCLSFGVCAGTTVYCSNGKEVCSYPSSYEVRETVCDGRDNDCNGFIDDVYRGQYCYSGAIGTEYNPPCHPGVLACIDSSVVCVNETLPVVESCDQIDNDCNGTVDDTSNVIRYDIVLAIDTSGSMCFGISLLSNVINALKIWLNNIEAYDFRFAILDIAPLYSGTGVFNRIRVVSDFSDAETTRNALSSMVCTGAGDESTYDSVYKTCDISNELDLTWRSDTHHMYLGFTDERGQTYLPSYNITESSIALECSDSDYKTTVFQWSKYVEDFDYICSETNGRCFYLLDNLSSILNDLSQIRYPSCQPM